MTDVRSETATAKSFRLALAEPANYLAGQHYLVRLTGPDGYRASRSYSVASAPDGTNEIELTVERLVNGEVSPFLHDVVMTGDAFEVRGPVGGWFVWRGDAPAILVGGGSGVVPLMAMLRLARREGRSDLVRLIASVRSPEDLYYADEIQGGETTIAYTRTAPEGFARPVGRLGPADFADTARNGATVYVCGSAKFADAATALLMDAGHDASSIRVERFGLSA